jgi:hypothetical protein
MKKFSRTLSKTIAMMISPPTRSPSERETALATKRTMMSGLPKKRTKLRRLAWFHAPPPGNENEPGGGGSERDAPPS